MSETYKASEILKVFFSELEQKNMQQSLNIVNGWKSVVERSCKEDPNTASKLASHSSVYDLKNGILQIVTDHSGWIQLFMMYQKSILRELKKTFPNLEIRSLSYTIKE